MQNSIRVTLLVLTLVAGFSNCCQAGWHHGHGFYYATPLYYGAPTAAPEAQNAPAARLLEALIPVLVDVAKQRIPGLINPQQPSVVDSSSLSALKSDLAQIAASVENANSTLRRHGEEIAILRLQLDDVNAKVDAIGKLVGDNGTLQKDVKNILDKLPKQTRQELMAALNSNEFFTPINAQIKLTQDERNALITALKTSVEAIVKRHYGDTSP